MSIIYIWINVQLLFFFKKGDIVFKMQYSKYNILKNPLVIQDTKSRLFPENPLRNIMSGVSIYHISLALNNSDLKITITGCMEAPGCLCNIDKLLVILVD